MKWFNLCSAVVMTFGLTTASQASLFDLFGHGSKGSCKSCACAPTCQPQCCEPVCCEPAPPTIERPCDTKVHTYQRQISTLQEPCCETACEPCCKPQCCEPAPCCQPCCAPKKKCLLGGLFGGCHKKQNCCEPTCCPQPCAQPCPQPCAQPCAQPCCAPKKKCFLGGLFGGCHKKQNCCQTQCCPQTCQQPCCEEVRCCDADPCEIAKLIYQSQTACYADDREDAVDNLGDFDANCNPEVLVALIYALNDASEEVRAEAADEIGDMLEDGRACCSQELIAALTCALADCDGDVRDQAEEALEACGYAIVDGCCPEQTCCNTCNTCQGGSCGYNGGTIIEGTPSDVPPAEGAAPMPAEGGEAAPAPAPPQDPKAYFPSRLQYRQTSYSRPAKKTGLAGLFKLLD